MAAYFNESTRFFIVIGSTGACVALYFFSTFFFSMFSSTYR